MGFHTVLKMRLGAAVLYCICMQRAMLEVANFTLLRLDNDQLIEDELWVGVCKTVRQTAGPGAVPCGITAV
jgi:hypothetical protein